MWLAVSWCCAAIVLAAVHHRLARPRRAMPREVERFLERLRMELSGHGIDWLGLLPGQFACLLRVGGQETPVSLHDLYRHAEAFPDRFGAVVARLVGEIREVGLDRVADHDFGLIATTLMPQVRSRAWVEAQGRFGDAALVQRPLAADLAIVYVIDDPHTMVFVCRAHLRRWRRSETDLHRLALANLRARGGAEGMRALVGDDPVLLQTGDGYDAARVLLLEQTEGLLVALPDRDTLWVGRERGGAGLAGLMAAAEGMTRAAAHPVSHRLYRLGRRGLEAVSDGSSR